MLAVTFLSVTLLCLARGGAPCSVAHIDGPTLAEGEANEDDARGER